MSLSAIEIKKSLSDLSSKVNVVVLDECSSTNDEANRLLRETTLPFCVLSRRQISGRGRMSRSWFSSENASICLSVVADMSKIKGDVLASATVRVGMAVCSSLNNISREKFYLKWPNDIYSSQGKKIAGMLAELKNIDGTYKIIFGIGLNYNLSLCRESLPKDIENSVDDIYSKLIEKKSINEIASIVIDATENALKKSILPSPDEYSKLDWLYGKNVNITIGNRNFSGTASGINSLGNLLVTLQNGSIEIVNSGEATLHKS